jgi:hypothetical protein
MESYKEIKGDLIKLIFEGFPEKEVITMHGINCFCIQEAGIAKQFSKLFSTDNESLYKMEASWAKGNYNKLGMIESHSEIIYTLNYGKQWTTVINAYTQYYPGPDARVNAIQLCLEKINHEHKGKFIILPLVGCGIGGLDFKTQVKPIIQKELKDMNVTVVHYDKNSK